MRAREPDRSGVIERDGVKVAYDVYGEGHTPAVFLLPTLGDHSRDALEGAGPGAGPSVAGDHDGSAR